MLRHKADVQIERADAEKYPPQTMPSQKVLYDTEE
jgi:hypothetical protein